MKRVSLILILLALVLVPGVSGVIHAQQPPIIIVPPNNPDSDGDGLPDSEDGCPNKAGPRANKGCPVDNGNGGSGSDSDQPSSDPENPNPDSDGDGLSDKDDRCPNEGGPTWTGGCPEEDPDPNRDDDNSQPPTFNPPALPVDGCHVTPRDNFKVNVRKEADASADILGQLAPGVVYPALGYIMQGTDIWFVMTNYEGSTGTAGYASRSVLLATACPQIFILPEGVAGGGFDPMIDFEAPGGDQPTLCHMTVGFDSPTWSDDPEVPSYTYAAFYFENDPDEPLPAGTKIWGVVFVQDFIILADSINVFAIAPDAALFETAMNSDYAGFYNWPTMEGGVISGGSKMFRLTGDVDKLGACGPIVGIDDFTAEPAGSAEMKCVAKPGTTILDSCYCPAGNEGCITNLAYFCNGYHDVADIYAEDDTVSCKFNVDASAIQVGTDCDYNGIPDHLEFPIPDCIDDIVINLPDIFEDDGPEDWELDFLWEQCPDGWVWDNETGLECETIIVEDNAPAGDCNENGIPDLDEFFPPDCYGKLTTETNNSGNGVGRNARNQVMEFHKGCIDDLTVWWIDVNPNDPFDYHGLGEGFCEDSIFNATQDPIQPGASRVIAGKGGDPEPIDDFSNGDNGETQKEDPEWWGTVLDMTCPGDWLMIIEIDADGDEVVTDAQCWDDIE